MWIIKPDHSRDRTIEFKGESIVIFNRDTEDTAEDHLNVNTATEYTMKAGYECIMHGGIKEHFFKLSDKAT